MHRKAVVAAAICLSLSAFAWAETKEELKKKFEKRHEEIQKLKNAGKVGETHEGYLGALKEEYIKKDKDLRMLIDAENADRKTLYGIIAKEQTTDKQEMTVEKVGNQNAKLKFTKAGENEYFKGKDGTWRTKSEMLKAKKDEQEKKNAEEEARKKAAKK